MHQTLTIASNLEELKEVSIWVKHTLPKTLTEKIRNNILLITQELVTNAILYGNKEIESKSVIITLGIKDSDILLGVEDQGEGLPKLPSKKEAQKMDYLDENGRGMKLTVLLSHKATVHKNKIEVIFKQKE
jgi:anti-sigma regulatory factor (Ser/Thr protein kinase)